MLHFQILLPEDGSAPARCLLLLHGLLGSGVNWRSFARRYLAARPGSCAALVDLRQHGASQHQPPPHTLASAAADLREVVAALPAPLGGILGHSFGGKVALCALADLRPAQAWIIDSAPSARPDARGSEGVLRVLAALRALPAEHERREAFVAALAGRGISVPVAQWLAMNLEPSGAALRLRLDLDSIEALLRDYLQRDLWPALTPPPPGVQVHLVVAGRSQVVSAEDQQHARRLAAENGQVTLHVLERSGHDVHIDDPAGLLALMTA